MDRNEYMAGWREKNRERLREYQRQYRAKNSCKLGQKQEVNVRYQIRIHDDDYYDKYSRRGISKKEWLKKYGYPMGDLSNWENWKGWDI